MKDVLKAIEERSSTRGYKEEKITKEELEAVIKAGLQAPTAANRQEIYFSVIEGTNPYLKELHEDLLKGRGGSSEHNFFYEAPYLIILSGPEGFFWSAVDAGIAVENMALAAEGLGLGSLILGCIKDVMTGEKKAYYNKAFGIPEGNVYQVAFAVGYKAVTKEPHEYSEEKNVTFI